MGWCVFKAVADEISAELFDMMLMLPFGTGG